MGAMAAMATIDIDVIHSAARPDHHHNTALKPACSA